MKSTCALFIGPSLPENALIPDFVDVFEPIKSGDIYSILTHGYSIIAIVDGLFHGVPSIWHREIISALDAGTAVWGASSMGALRACELKTAGMEGFGHIFNWYSDGLIDGDDEVALHHLADSPYSPLTTPLVDIRYCLMQDHGLEPGQYQHENIIQTAQMIPYWERTPRSLETCLLDVGLNSSFVRELMISIANTESVKRVDAKLLIDSLCSAELSTSCSFSCSSDAVFKSTTRVDLYGNLCIHLRTQRTEQRPASGAIAEDSLRSHSNRARCGGIHSLISFWFEDKDSAGIHNIVLSRFLAEFNTFSECFDLTELLHSTRLTRNEVAHYAYLSCYFHELYESKSNAIDEEYLNLANSYIGNNSFSDPVRPSFPRFGQAKLGVCSIQSIVAFEIFLAREAFQAYGIDRAHLVRLYESLVKDSRIIELHPKLQDYLLAGRFGIEPLGCSVVSQSSHLMKYYRFLSIAEMFL
jgi:hypothetical protein